MRPAALLLLCMVPLAGCVEYASVPPASQLPPATGVRVRLSRPMDFPITDVTVRDVVELQGETVGVRDTSMFLSVFDLKSQSGIGVEAAGETVAFPRTAVVQLDRRRISPWKSGIVAALIVAAGFAVKESGLVSSSAGGGPPSGGTTK